MCTAGVASLTFRFPTWAAYACGPLPTTTRGPCLCPLPELHHLPQSLQLRDSLGWQEDLTFNWFAVLVAGTCFDRHKAASTLMMRSFVVLVTGTIIYGKGDEKEIAEEIAEGEHGWMSG